MTPFLRATGNVIVVWFSLAAITLGSWITLYVAVPSVIQRVRDRARRLFRSAGNVEPEITDSQALPHYPQSTEPEEEPTRRVLRFGGQEHVLTSDPEQQYGAAHCH